MKGNVYKRVVRKIGDGVTDQKTGDKTESGRVKGVKILFGSDKDGQNQKQTHERDSESLTI